MQKIICFPRQSFRWFFQSCLRFCGGVVIALAWLALSSAQAQTTNYSLGTTSLLEGPAAGSDSVILCVNPNAATWTAMANAGWLHLAPANQNGTGSTNVIFSFDANSSATRVGTLTIGGQTLTVTQAGSTYVAAGQLTTLVLYEYEPVGDSGPVGLAVDGFGDLYWADYDSTLDGSEIEEWTVGSAGMSLLVYWQSRAAQGVAVDGYGDVFIADSWNNAILESQERRLTQLVGSNSLTPLYNPQGVAVNSAGDVYIADTGDNAIKEWNVADQTLTTLVSSQLNNPHGLAVDIAGNVYIADAGNNAIKEWTPANGSVTQLVFSGLSDPHGVAVDGAGNVYIADTYNNAIKKCIAASGSVITLVSSVLYDPSAVAVDGKGNVYICDTGNGAIEELPYAFVDPTPKLESLAAGHDTLPVVLPSTENLLPPFTPTSDQSWLTIDSIANGVVSFSFTAAASNRTAHITLLGQSIPVTQGIIGTPPTLTGVQMLRNGVCQFLFSNTPGALFSVLSTTNLSLPLSNWTVLGSCTNSASNLFQFTSPPTTNDEQRFYMIRSI